MPWATWAIWFADDVAVTAGDAGSAGLPGALALCGRDVGIGHAHVLEGPDGLCVTVDHRHFFTDFEIGPLLLVVSTIADLSLVSTQEVEPSVAAGGLPVHMPHVQMNFGTGSGAMTATRKAQAGR